MGAPPGTRARQPVRCPSSYRESGENGDESDTADGTALVVLVEPRLLDGRNGLLARGAHAGNASHGDLTSFGIGRGRQSRLPSRRLYGGRALWNKR